MSGQTFAGPNDPYWLSSKGVDSVSFNKLSAPPLAFLDKGVMYELTDGLLYYNGNEIAMGDGIVSGPTVSTVGAVSVWNDTTGDSLDNSAVFVKSTGTNIAISNAVIPSLAGATQDTFIGAGSGQLITTGSNNIGLGYLAGRTNTTGSGNIHIGHTGAIESDTIRLGTSQTRAFCAGVRGVSVTSGLPVVCDASGQLGTGLLNKYSTGGLAIMDGNNANVFGGVQSATLFDATNLYANVAPFAITFTTFRFKFMRVLSVAEDINVRLIVNGTPVASLSTGAWGATFVPATPISGTADAFSITLAAGDQWYILINAFTATTPDNYLCWSLA